MQTVLHQSLKHQTPPYNNAELPNVTSKTTKGLGIQTLKITPPIELFKYQIPPTTQKGSS